jgi:hypothetical protein
MIASLNEINRVLLALRRLTKQRKSVPRGILTDFLKGAVVLAQNPEFEPVLDFSVRLGVVSIRKSEVSIATLGEELLAENAAEIYELQPRQKILLFRRCYLDGPLRPEMKKFVKFFSVDSASGKIIWSSLDSEPFGEIEWVSQHLVQLDVLNASQHLLVVSDHHNETISQFLDEGGDYTEEQMEENLREKRLLSDLAETFVVEYEKSRLADAGHKLESACVQRISKHRVNAGYDVNSFTGGCRNLNHDRFIEVKGSGKATVYFFWSLNEMKKAEKFGDKYWIYFVGGIDRKKRLVTRHPVMIQNPHTGLKSDTRFQIQPSTMLVEGNICGNLIAGKSAAKNKPR